MRENLVHNHTNLLEDAGNRLMSAIEKSGDNKGLQRAENRIRNHLRILENLREKENLPEHARLAISLAISRSVRSRVVISDIQADNLPQPAEGGKVAIAERLSEVRNRVQELKEEIKENRAKGQPASEIIQNIEIGTGRHLMEKFKKMANQGRS